MVKHTPSLARKSFAPAPPEFLWDSTVPELALRCRGRSRSWIVQTRVAGRTVRRKIGDDRLAVAEARQRARTMLENLTPETAPLIADFATRFLADCSGQWMPGTKVRHASNIKRLILPGLGHVPIATLSRQAVIDWHRALPCAPATANRALAVLSSMMRHAELCGLRASGTNPCQKLRRRVTAFKAAYLDVEGYRRLGRVLRREAGAFPRAVPLVWFIALTGCRKSEAMRARWDQCEGDRLALPDSKTGPKAIWLGHGVRRLLAGLPRVGGGIFAGDDVSALRRELGALWSVVRRDLDLPRLRIHDLRHSFASVAVNNGHSLRMIGGLLGHADLATTAGYAHLDNTTLVAASQRVGQHLARAFQAKARPKTRSKPITPAHFEGYLASGLSLQEYCQRQGFSVRTFRSALRAWYRVHKVASVARCAS